MPACRIFYKDDQAEGGRARSKSELVSFTPIGTIFWGLHVCYNGFPHPKSPLHCSEIGSQGRGPPVPAPCLSLASRLLSLPPPPPPPPPPTARSASSFPPPFLLLSSSSTLPPSPLSFWQLLDVRCWWWQRRQPKQQQPPARASSPALAAPALSSSLHPVSRKVLGGSEAAEAERLQRRYRRRQR